MNAGYDHKSTVDEIRQRFDADVERFSNLETGQAAALDSPLHIELLTSAARAVTPNAQHILDLGCGAGNYTLKLLQKFGGAAPTQVTLIDLSQPMLDRATQRIRAASPDSQIEAVQSDVRAFDFGHEHFDIVMAAQCLHHLRGEDEWDAVFSSVFRSLRPGGSFWIADSLEYGRPPVRAMMWDRWGEYLKNYKDAAYRDQVFGYVEKEDTPRPLFWQLAKLKAVGFADPEVLHVNSRFASFGAVRPG